VANGIPELDEDRLAERDAPAQSRVLALGRTVPQRRPEACARILAAIADLGEVAWIGGGGGDRGTAGFAALVRAGIEPTGWLPRESVMRELESAAAYLHWTAWDGLPLSVLEAMAADAVVVASDIGPNREVLGPRQVCSTEEQAALLLRRILVEPELRRELLASQHRRRRHYGAARMTREWLALYARLAGA
jgi:glycosyltransferase involved in cell wall biosynthesis